MQIMHTFLLCGILENNCIGIGPLYNTHILCGHGVLPGDGPLPGLAHGWYFPFLLSGGSPARARERAFVH